LLAHLSLRTRGEKVETQGMTGEELGLHGVTLIPDTETISGNNNLLSCTCDYFRNSLRAYGRGCLVSSATRYGLDSPGI